jgi:hypothetical protein
MRRALEVALVVLVLVAVPVGVAVIARSEPSPGPPQLSALAFAQPILALTHVTPTHCEWTNDHADIACAGKAGWTCTFRVRAHAGRCSEEKGESSQYVIFNWKGSAP